MPTDPMVFKWGRTDCDDSPSTSEVHEFPEPTMDRSSMMDYFSEHYEMNENEVGEQKLKEHLDKINCINFNFRLLTGYCLNGCTYFRQL